MFYRTPTPEAVKSWREQTGKDFILLESFKVHYALEAIVGRSVNSLELLEERYSLLGQKAGPILFQLPPQF